MNTGTESLPSTNIFPQGGDPIDWGIEKYSCVVNTTMPFYYYIMETVHTTWHLMKNNLFCW